MDESDQSRLIDTAKQASERAYAPYSAFKVGAAALTKRGKTYTGCNVENVSYGLTICAERVALFSAVADGAQDVVAIAIYADTAGPTSPCGACRQVIHELAPGATVVMASPNADPISKSEAELLPYSFEQSDLTKNSEGGKP